MEDSASSSSSTAAAKCRNDGCSTGTSRLVPTWALLLTRALSTVFIFASFVYVWAARGYSMIYLTNWSFLLLLVSFLSLTAASLLMVMDQTSPADMCGYFSAPVYFVASTMALYVVPVYFAFLGKPPFTYANLVVHGLQLIPIALDLLLGARYRFRFVHVFFNIAFLALYMLVQWIRYGIWHRHRDFFWPYGFLNFKKQKAGNTVGLYVGFFVWVIVASLIVLGVSRGYNFLLDKCVGSRSPDAVQELDKGSENDAAADV